MPLRARPWLRWLTFNELGDGPVPPEAIALRLTGVAVLVTFVAITCLTAPRPGLQGDGHWVLAAMVVLIAAAIVADPWRMYLGARRTVLALLAIAGAALTLAALQPNGYWEAGLYFVGIMAAVRLQRTGATLILLGALLPFVVGSLVQGHINAAVSLPLGIVPWFLVMRALRMIRDQRLELESSRAAAAETAAQAAAVAERSRLAREMHDVLAHSLSALALQLESTRLLSRAHGADEQLTQAIDRAHQLAVGGLDEARRAIAAERERQLPGPEAIPALADAFAENSGLPVALEVRGEPQPLVPEARLAVYRTAQEALTNIRRHATPQRVEVRLDYGADATTLVVEDHVLPGSPAPPAPADGAGYGLTGMRERAQLLGGELVAAPTRGGFRVELRIPAPA